MSTDTENAEQGKSSDSSRTRRQAGRADRSQANSRRNSRNAPAKDAGSLAGPNPESLNWLLSVLQSDLGEIRDAGGTVRLFDDPSGLIIQLPNVATCLTHKMFKFGPQCPLC